MDVNPQPASPDNPPNPETIQNVSSTHDASLPDPFNAMNVTNLDQSIPGTPPASPKPPSRKSSILSALREKTSRNSSNLDASTQQDKSGSGTPPGDQSSRRSSKLDASSKGKSGTSIQEQSNLDSSTLDKNGPGSPGDQSSRKSSKLDASGGPGTPNKSDASKLDTSAQDRTDTSIRTPSVTSKPKSQLSVQDPGRPEVRVTSATATSSRLSLEDASTDISQWDLTPYQFNCPLLPQDIVDKDYNELGSIQLPEYYQLVDHTLATVFKCISNGRRDVRKLQPDQVLWALKMIEAHQVAERDMASENVRLLKQLLGEIVISMCAGGIPERRPITELPRPEGLPDESLEESFTLGRLPVARRLEVSDLPSKTIPPAAASTPMPSLDESINSTLPSVLDKSMTMPSTPPELDRSMTLPPASETSSGTRTPPMESSAPLHTSTPFKSTTPPPKKTSIVDLREGLRQIHELFSEYKTSRLERNEGDKLNLLAIERLLIDMGAKS